MPVCCLPSPCFRWRSRISGSTTGTRRSWRSCFGLPPALFIASVDVHEILVVVEEYFSFITLLAALFVISGGIHLRGDIRATPLANSLFLLVGAVLANLIGTTGASMLLIRPVLRTNRERTRTRHIPVFFIFLVSNIGGLLLPIGDPPLFLGYLQGVPFFWTLKLLPIWLFVVAAVLAIFFVVDTLAYRREPTYAVSYDRAAVQPLRMVGTVNLLWLAGVLGAAIFLGIPEPGRCHDPDGAAVLVDHQRGGAPAQRVHLPSDHRGRGPLRGDLRGHGPLPAHPEGTGRRAGPRPGLAVLLGDRDAFVLPGQRPHLPDLRLAWRRVSRRRWACRRTSSCAAAAITEPLLIAVSAGAVLMGANTYIGNAPNFMVKCISEEWKVKVPSFFGYMVWSGAILLPVFAAATLIFFR